jgi:high affinity Mn2+ porin
MALDRRSLLQLLSIAAFPNLDAVRDATLSEAPYLARAMYHQVFALSINETAASRGPLSTLSELPSRRLELRIGKIRVTDFFVTNSDRQGQLNPRCLSK